MQREAMLATNGGAPGKPAWRQAITDALKQVDVVRSACGIEMTFGYKPGSLPDLVKAMIVTEGSGSAVGNPPIHAGPHGRQVWDEDVSGKHPSRAMAEYDLPDAFNQVGNQFIANSIRMFEKRFGEILEVELARMPDGAYYGNVHVTGG